MSLHTQGDKMTESQILHIVELLRNTDLTIAEIATRMGRVSATISKVNRDYKVRTYTGRTHWVVNN